MCHRNYALCFDVFDAGVAVLFLLAPTVDDINGFLIIGLLAILYISYSVLFIRKATNVLQHCCQLAPLSPAI
jgi:NADH:ubiquinone oxidoreductase subunit 3 (subunit A)